MHTPQSNPAQPHNTMTSPQHHSLAALPQPVVDAILQRLQPPHLAAASLVCVAWRDLLYEHLPPKLVVSSTSPQAAGVLAAGLHRCRNLQAICVSSSREAIWPSFAAALAAQPLTSLRKLHVQHSSHTDAAHLEQLRTILQVQGPQCALHLALTDKASLQALLPLLPLAGLASLELNVPYLAEGVLQLLLHAATVQAAGATAQRHNTDPPPQCVLRVGLWVCCWGGCPGLLLADALSLHGKLQLVPGCWMVGCESITITISSSDADLLALSQLQGLQALGFNFNSSSTHSANHGLQPSAPEAGAVGVTGGGVAAAPHTAAAAADSSSGLCLQPLTALSSSLQQLSIRGSPEDGWGAAPPLVQQQQQQHSGLERHPLAALTGLTKLSLLKDWSKQALSVAPIAALTLLQELALERHRLQHSRELCCLSSLTALKVLSLVLTVTADELVDGVQEGSWAPAGQDGGVMPAHWQQQQQEGEGIAGQLSMLRLQAAAAAAADCGGTCSAGPAAAAASGVAVCTCCCSFLNALAGSDTHTAALPAAEQLLQQVQACPLSRAASNPVLLDWTWLAHLQQLETAWLQVPHLDLSCLPSSLVELDAQQPRDLTRVSITCSSRGCWVLDLPRLQRLVLPHLLRPHSTAALLGHVDAADTTSSSSSDSYSEDGSDSDSSSQALQQHYETAVLLAIVMGCPELKEVELVQWQPSCAVLLAAAERLPFLRVLSVVGPEEGCDELREQLAAVRRAQGGARPVDLQLQEPLVLSSFPWSSVLDAR